MNYVARSCDLGRDRQSLLNLWQRNLPEAKADRYEWLYQGGPAEAWLLEAEDGSVVGSTGLMRRTFCAGGHTIRAGQAIDLNVDRDHRTVGPAVALQRAVTAAIGSGGLDFVYGFPNRQSAAVLRRAGYRELGELGRWVKPLSCRAGFKGPGWLSLFRAGAAAVVDPWLWLKSAERQIRLPSNLRVEVAERFDARFDDLYQAASARLPLLGERTADYLQWRFARSPGSRYQAFCLSNRSDGLLGYVVYSRQEKTVHVGDMLFIDPAALDLLLAEFLRAMRRQRAHAVVLVYLGNAVVPQTLGRFGFWPRPTNWKAMLCADPEQPALPLEQLLDADNWYLTRADVDTDE